MNLNVKVHVVSEVSILFECVHFQCVALPVRQIRGTRTFQDGGLACDLFTQLRLTGSFVSLCQACYLKLAAPKNAGVGGAELK